jgi:hypothetical protein
MQNYIPAHDKFKTAATTHSSSYADVHNTLRYAYSANAVSGENNMDVVCKLSTEENVACQLADLAFRLHRRGLMDPYQKVVEARDALLLILGEKAAHRSMQEKSDKKEKASVIPHKPYQLAVPTRLLQGTEIRKSERAAA